MKTTEEIFNAVKRRLNINHSQKTDIGYKFTYHKEIKSWSHRVELIRAEDGSTFLITSRRLKIKDFEKYLFQNFNEHEANYKIPIHNEEQVMGILKEYDNFKLS